MIRWTSEMYNYLLSIYKHRFVGDIKDMMNNKFNLNFTSSSVKTYLLRHGLKTGYKGKKTLKTFTPEQEEWIKANRYGYGRLEFTNLVNEHFHTNFTENQVKGFCERNHIVSGISSKFEKGCVPHNKGKKGDYPKGSEKGWFKKGYRPSNTRPVGTEVIDRDGYTSVKIAEPNVWQLKQRYIWEQSHEKLKDNEVVMFLDGDKTNFNIENLRLVTRGEMAILNKYGRIQSGNAEINQAGITITRIENAIKNKIGERN